MKPPKEFFEPFTEGTAEQNVAAVFKICLVMGIELFALVLHYAAYTQTMTLMPGSYLVDVPGIGWLFAYVPDMQVNHLVAAFMALASVATPVIGFYYLLSQRVFADPGAYFAHVPHRIYAGVLVCFWALMIGVEIVNVLTLIESYIRNPFIRNDVVDAFRRHEGMAFLSAVVIAIVNAAIGLGTAVAWHAILGRKED